MSDLDAFSNQAGAPAQLGQVPPDAVIAIDGPAGSGKSSTARALAKQFGLLYVDTGAMYRALTWAALGAGLEPGEEARIASLLAGARLELRPGEDEARVFWDGRDVSAAIRTPAVEAAVSHVSAHAEVRREMVERQRALARRAGVVMEGRDIGSAVFPLATAKLYLDATVEARVERRVRQHRLRGHAVDPAAVAADLAERDRLDSARRQSPLTISPDAAVLETSAWQLPEQIERAAAAVAAIVAQQTPPPALPDQPRLCARRRVVYAVFGVLARFYGLREQDRRQLDLPGGVIVAPMHLSYWDAPLVGATLRRPALHTLAKAELFRLPPMRAVLRTLDAVPIRRSGFDAGAFHVACEHLAAGRDILIFPEGTRRPPGRPGPVRSGLGLLMQRSLAPAVPVFVRGTRGLQPGGSSDSPLEVRFAPAVRLRALPALRARHDERQISARIGALFEAIYGELQARSFAQNPQTAWEIADRERAAVSCARREARVFGSRAPA